MLQVYSHEHRVADALEEFKKVRGTTAGAGNKPHHVRLAEKYKVSPEDIMSAFGAEIIGRKIRKSHRKIVALDLGNATLKRREDMQTFKACNYVRQIDDDQQTHDLKRMKEEYVAVQEKNNGLRVKSGVLVG